MFCVHFANLAFKGNIERGMQRIGIGFPFYGATEGGEKEERTVADTRREIPLLL